MTYELFQIRLNSKAIRPVMAHFFLQVAEVQQTMQSLVQARLHKWASEELKDCVSEVLDQHRVDEIRHDVERKLVLHKEQIADMQRKLDSENKQQVSRLHQRRMRTIQSTDERLWRRFKPGSEIPSNVQRRRTTSENRKETRSWQRV